MRFLRTLPRGSSGRSRTLLAKLTLLACLALGGFAASAADAAAQTGTAAAAWGDNVRFELGAGYRTHPGEDRPVSVLEPVNIASVATGEHFTLALLSDGTVQAWGGGNLSGQFGDGSVGTQGIVDGQPVAVAGLTEVKAIAAAGLHSLAVIGNGTVEAWGSNAFGQLGHGELNPGVRKNPETNTLESTMEGTGSAEPVPVEWSEGLKNLKLGEVVAVASGGGSDYALKANGKLFAWGRNDRGQLGIGEAGPETCKTEVGEVPCSTKPRQVVPPAPVKKGEAHITALAAGSQFALALLSDGTVWSWGNNGKGELGTSGKGIEATSDVPVEVEDVTEAVAIAAGAEHALALLKTGKVAGWGTNGYGQLGSTTSEECQNVPCYKTPKVVKGLKEVTAIAAGFAFSLALHEGKVYALGRNRAGELGIGTMTGPELCREVTNEANEVTDYVYCSRVPKEVAGLGPVRGIAAGYVFGIALLKSGVAGPPAQLTLTPGEASLKVDWTFSAAEYLLRWFKYEECPKEAKQLETDNECNPREVAPTVTLGGKARSYEFRGLEPTQQYEIEIRSFSSIEQGGEEFRRFIVGAPLSRLPTLTKIQPGTGPVSGGTAVTITGANFSEVSAVKFGSTNARKFEVVSPTSISAVSPKQAAGAVDVTVTTPEGTSALSPADRFKFAPTITSVSPNSGPLAGGTAVTVTGEGFALATGATAFRFGSTPATVTGCVSSKECTVIAPALEAGTVEVKATVNNVSSAKTSADQFTYG